MSLPSFLPVYRYVPGLQVTKLDENNSSIVRLQSEPTSSIGTSAYIISKSGVDAVLAKHDRDGQSVREFVIVCIIENIIYYTHMLCMMHIYSLCFSYYILFYTLYHMYMLCYTRDRLYGGYPQHHGLPVPGHTVRQPAVLPLIPF